MLIVIIATFINCHSSHHYHRHSSEYATVIVFIYIYHCLISFYHQSSSAKLFFLIIHYDNHFRSNYFLFTNLQVVAQCSAIKQNSVDQMASNGILHEITRVMIPPSGNIVQAVAGCPVFKTLVKAVTVAGLADTLSSKYGQTGNEMTCNAAK
jgi:hypothetical protein